MDEKGDKEEPSAKEDVRLAGVKRITAASLSPRQRTWHVGRGRIGDVAGKARRKVKIWVIWRRGRRKVGGAS